MKEGEVPVSGKELLKFEQNFPKGLQLIPKSKFSAGGSFTVPSLNHSSFESLNGTENSIWLLPKSGHFTMPEVILNGAQLMLNYIKCRYIVNSVIGWKAVDFMMMYCNLRAKEISAWLHEL